MNQFERESLGKAGCVYVKGATATAGDFSVLQVLTPTTFSELTNTLASGAITGVELPAGTILLGRFIAFTGDAEGNVCAYHRVP